MPSQGQQTDRLIGEAPTFLAILEITSQIAPLEKPVLIVGERGTGKELIASRLHYLSKRWDQEFLKMNCAAISDTLLETELFGHEAGAFTGAQKLHRGRFERANHGTLFLDELATSSTLVQEKLLRIIEHGEFDRVGGSQTLTTDVRLIAATNEDLPRLANKGKFREDLLDRLAFDVITLPPLRSRPEDIIILAEHFAVTMAIDLGRKFFPGFTATAQKILKSYHWPGNIRELKNVVERSVYRWQNEIAPVDLISLDPFDSPFRPNATNETLADASSTSLHKGTTHKETTAANTPSTNTIVSLPKVSDFPLDFKQSVQDYEISLLKQALATNQYNQKKTADALEVTYHQLRGYLKKYDLLDNN